jgi:hypothetical protein
VLPDAKKQILRLRCASLRMTSRIERVVFGGRDLPLLLQ